MAKEHTEPNLNSGFTLVELLIVITLIAIVSVIATPRWLSSPNLDAQLQQILSDMRYTQELAMTHGQPFRFNILSSNTYNITDLNGNVVANHSTGTSSINLAPGITFNSLSNLPNSLIAFNTSGVPYVDSSAEIPLATNAIVSLTINNANRSIVVTPQTGWVKAQ